MTSLPVFKMAAVNTATLNVNYKFITFEYRPFGIDIPKCKEDLKKLF